MLEDLLESVTSAAVDAGWETTDGRERQAPGTHEVSWSLDDSLRLWSLCGLADLHGDWSEQRLALTDVGVAAMLTGLRTVAAGPKLVTLETWPLGSMSDISRLDLLRRLLGQLKLWESGGEEVIAVVPRGLTDRRDAAAGCWGGIIGRGGSGWLWYRRDAREPAANREVVL